MGGQKTKYTLVEKKPRVGKSDQRKWEKKQYIKTEIETEICRGGNVRAANKEGMTEGKRAH